MSETTKQEVVDLLENFKDYVNSDGVEDPWFTLDEINQQFAWDDIPHNVLRRWLKELVAEGNVESRRVKVFWREWRWLKS